MRESQGHDGLFAGGMFLQARGGRRDVRGQSPSGERGLRQSSETTADEVHDRLAVEGTAHADHDIIRHDELVMQLGEVRRFDQRQGLRRAARVDRQRMGAEILALEAQAGLLDDVVLGFAAGADQGGAFGGESLGEEPGRQDAVGHQFGELVEIRTQGLAPEPAGDLRAVVRESGSESVDQLGDFLLGASGVVPGEQRAEQTGRAALGFVLIGDAGRQEDAESRLGDGIVVLQHHPDAVIQRQSLEPIRRGCGGSSRRDGLHLRRAHGAEGHVLRAKPLAGLPGKVFGAEAGQMFDAALRPGDVISDRRSVGYPAGQAMDVLLSVDHPDHGLAAHLGELIGGDAALE